MRALLGLLVAAGLVALALVAIVRLGGGHDADPLGLDRSPPGAWVSLDAGAADADPGAPGRPGIAAGPPDAVAPPPPPAGERFEHELIEPPSVSFGEATWTGSDTKYAADVDGVEGVAYDPALGRAARELAVFYSIHGAPAPTEALQFILNSAGAAEWGVLQSYLWTTDVGDDAVRRRIEQLADELAFRTPAGRGAAGAAEGARFGVGEAFTVGPRPERIVAVVTSRGGLFLDAVPRQVAPGAPVAISGSLPRGARDPRVVALFPGGAWVEADGHVRGERFTARLEPPRGERGRGPLLVELLATLSHGPTPLAQLELVVGAPLPERFEGYWSDDESAIRTDAAAERRALDLLARDRARHGLPPLALDARLSAIARDHGRDMRDAGFFGHVSPTTGGVADRLARAGYQATSFAENIAANGSLHDAQAGLYYSLGHRKNILGPDFTHVGLGVVPRDSHGKRQWLVTQVFARPVARVDPAAAAADLYRRIAATHRRLVPDAALEEAARGELRAASPSPRGALDRAGRAGLTQRGAWASVVRLPDLGDFEVPDELSDPTYRRVAVAVRQDVGAPPPNILVVVIVTGG